MNPSGRQEAVDQTGAETLGGGHQQDQGGDAEEAHGANLTTRGGGPGALSVPGRHAANVGAGSFGHAARVGRSPSEASDDVSHAPGGALIGAFSLRGVMPLARPATRRGYRVWGVPTRPGGGRHSTARSAEEAAAESAPELVGHGTRGPSVRCALHGPPEDQA